MSASIARPLRGVYHVYNLFFKSADSLLGSQSIRWATHKSSGSSKNKRKRTPGKHRGPYVADGDSVHRGQILVRQLGLKYFPGENVACFNDKTLVAMEAGKVIVSTEKLTPYPHSPMYKAIKAGKIVHKIFYNVIPEPQQQKFRLVSQV